MEHLPKITPKDFFRLITTNVNLGDFGAKNWVSSDKKKKDQRNPVLMRLTAYRR